MRQALGGGDRLQRQRPGRQHLERAVLESVSNRRPSDSSAASSSATHSTPGAMRDSRLRSGPKAQRQHRHDHQIEAERHADGAAFLPGDRKIAAHQLPERAHAACAVRAEMQLARLGEAERHMRRRHHHAAARQMRVHSSGQGFLRRRSSDDGRLVEQPDRPLRQQQPRKPQAAASVRPTDSRPGMSRRAARPNVASAARCVRAAAAEEAAPEGRVLLDGQARFHRVEMPDIVALLAQSALRRRRPRGGCCPQQDAAGRRSCGSAWSCRRRSVPAAASASPGCDAERQIREQRAPAANAGQLVG